MRFARTSLLACALSLSAAPALAFDPLNAAASLQVSPPASCNLPSAESELTLAQAVEIALCNNPDTHAFWAQAKAASATVGQARSAYLPTVSGELDADYHKTDGRSFVNAERYGSYGPTLNLSYLIYDFGGREAAVESAKQFTLESGWNYNSVVQSLIFQVIKGYFDVFTAQESLAATAESETASKEAFGAARARLDVGVVTPADTAQAETAYAQAVLDRERAQNTLKRATGGFASLLHLPPQSELKLTAVDPEAAAKPMDGEVQAYIDAALARRPDLAAFRAREKRLAADLNRAEALGLPSLSVVGSTNNINYTSGAESSRGDSIIGVHLSIPIFSGFNDTYVRKQAKYTLEAASADVEKTEDSVALDVWNSYHNYQTAQRSYAAAESLLSSARASEALGLGRYKEGKGTLLDALDAQAKLASARLQWVQARYDTLITRFDLLRAVGDQASLERPVEPENPPPALPAAAPAVLEEAPAENIPVAPEEIPSSVPVEEFPPAGILLDTQPVDRSAAPLPWWE